MRSHSKKDNRMKTKTIIVLLVTFLFATCAAAADIYVISHEGLSLKPDDVRDVFLGGKQYSGSVRLAPVDNASAQQEFFSKVLKMNSERYSTVWMKKSFRDGVNPPAVKSGDAATLDFVKRNPGGIGYVKSAPSGVTIIKKY